MKNAVLSLFLAAFAFAGLQAQGTGAGGGGSTTGTSGSAGGAGTGGATTGGSGTGTPTIGRVPSQTPSSQSNSNQGQQIQRSIFIVGKVMMDDGSPIPPNVVIQRVCGGNPRSVAYTDSKGHFSFQWGQSNGMGLDASESGGGGFGSFGSSPGGFGGAQSAGGGNPLASDPYASHFASCEIRAQLGGFRSDSVNLITRNPMDNPDIGIIVLHRMGNVEGTSISVTSLMAPKDAKKAYEKGLQSVLKNKSDDATKEFEKAVQVYPKYADAWMNLGRLRLQQKAFEPAKEAMLKAMEADPKLVGPYIDLGLLSAREMKWEEAGQYLDRGLKLDPVDFPNAWYPAAVASYNLKKYDQAEKHAREAVKTDVRHRNPRSQYLLGLILVEKKDYPASADQFREYLKIAPGAPDFDKVKEQLAQLEKYLLETKEALKQ
jgi:tetratricopeptide (TPR) repeat protein